jgi:glutathione peroxidase
MKMKKLILFLVNIFILAQLTNAQGYQQLSFTTIDGENFSLSFYSGKKVLFIIAPLAQADSSFTQIQSFASRYQDTVKVIAIPSFEDGYQATNATALKAMYSNTGIVLTEGMHTKKTSGANQSLLMKWLTDKSRNYHYDMDAQGIGQKFFVSEQGSLFAVLVPQTSLQHPIVNSIVHTSVQ